MVIMISAHVLLWCLTKTQKKSIWSHYKKKRFVHTIKISIYTEFGTVHTSHFKILKDSLKLLSSSISFTKIYNIKITLVTLISHTVCP